MTASSRVCVLVLAAGKGTRMHSDLPKVLQPLLEEPMLRYVYDALPEGMDAFTVIGHGAGHVRAAFPERAFILQAEQRGTGHALQTAMPDLAAYTHALVVNGDTPLMPKALLEGFTSEALASGADLALVTLTPPDTASFGLVLRLQGAITAIVEAKDFDPAAHGPKPGEINAGIYCLRLEAVRDLLPRLSNANKSGEYYITDLVALAREKGLRLLGLECGDAPELLGVNSPSELVRAEELLRESIIARHLAAGALIRAAAGVRIGPDARLAPGADVTGPCEIYGKSEIGAGARVCSHCRLEDAHLAPGATLRSFSHVEGARLATGAVAGPYARLRPGTVLEEDARVGNFVEVKKARLRRGAKASHLTYIGDADVGEEANIGAGTITCNYDGKNKHQTRIGSKAFIGSNTALVAPVSIGDEALIGAGSVITKDVEAGRLALTRAPQRDLPRTK